MSDKHTDVSTKSALVSLESTPDALESAQDTTADKSEDTKEGRAQKVLSLWPIALGTLVLAICFSFVLTTEEPLPIEPLIIKESPVPLSSGVTTLIKSKAGSIKRALDAKEDDAKEDEGQAEDLANSTEGSNQAYSPPSSSGTAAHGGQSGGSASGGASAGGGSSSGGSATGGSTGGGGQSGGSASGGQSTGGGQSGGSSSGGSTSGGGQSGGSASGGTGGQSGSSGGSSTGGSATGGSTGGGSSSGGGQSGGSGSGNTNNGQIWYPPFTEQVWVDTSSWQKVYVGETPTYGVAEICSTCGAHFFGGINDHLKAEKHSGFHSGMRQTGTKPMYEDEWVESGYWKTVEHPGYWGWPD
ncbi:MAG: hypothetical protein FWD27_01045 [Coriobacteriia bacterium]|nr:hypothetical protein [Coriobacteriia bacterium]